MPAYKYTTKDGTVRWMASFWYEDWTGKRKKKKKEGFALKREALDYEREYLRKAAKRCDMSFASLVELYREDADHRVRGSTRGTQDSIIDKWLLPFFGSLPVDKIDAVTVRKWQNTMLSAVNPHSGRPYAPTYLRTVNSRLSAVFNYAVMYYGLPQNPCLPAGFMGRKRAGRMKFWTLEEFEAVVAQVQKRGFRLAFLVMYWLGLRVGECLALTPADILPSGAVRVEKTHHRVAGEDVAGPPKTDNSVRDVPAPSFLLAELRAYVSALYDIGPGDRIFYFTHGTLNKELDRAAAAAGVQRIRIHDLRHSHAALLVELGYSIVAVAERLGDTVEVAMSTYSHLYPDKMEGMAADLDRRARGSGGDLAGLPERLEAVENGPIWIDGTFLVRRTKK
nr:tyrosine-type recombinase/integrase [uncultured Dysosmobacter sp.]